MRAREFLTEKVEGKITKRQQWGTRGLHRFKDADGRDRFYELNRVMMAAANPYGGSNTAAIPAGVTKLLLVP
jgi:hypothetical protein